jgi:putative flippase GtrA
VGLQGWADGGPESNSILLADERREPTMTHTWRGRLRSLVADAWKFGAIGLACFVIDVLVFNLLRTGAGWGPIESKLLSAVVSTIVAWLANRHWTFRRGKRENFATEFVEFMIIAGIGAAIGAGCLWISHYVLGFQTIVADNISGNVIGLALATTFRFFLYRHWVFDTGRRERSAALREERRGDARDEQGGEHHVGADQERR